ncbi:hypothetical protein MNBD_GAMMA07-2762 [hydrothermal vent metagenome]|uniref:HMA domain-containing protein n=1 Tax=hydrothermal vent metagenome TaxID=652676 RepID=A0A3B0X3X4_9ZZZZ
MTHKIKKLIILGTTLILWSQLNFAAGKTYNLKVDGLVCPFCEYNIKKKLSKLDNIESVDVNLKKGTVDIIVAEGKDLQEKIVKQEIKDAGFTLKSIKVKKVSKK